MPLTSTQDKAQIKLTTYRYPAQNTKGVVIFFHSLGYHMGVFANLAKYLASNGYTFVGYDQRGHGKSEGERGYFDDYKLIMKDANNFIGAIFKTYPNVPVFLMAHGMGCLLSIVFSQEFKEFKFAGLILGGPALKKPANSKVMSAISDFALKLMPNSAGIFPLVF
jgi:acylglycerol lipase